MNRYDIALGRDPPTIEASSEIQYHGWINCRVASRQELIAMGVKGEIKLENEFDLGNPQVGMPYYSHCIITETLARALQKKSKHFYVEAFTAVDNQGNQFYGIIPDRN